MKKGIVIGGGLAGLTAASYLSANGFNISLFEASPKLGGRAYSFYDPEFGGEIDNGQHLLMGCYKYTLDFFKLIGSYDNLEIQENLSVNYVDKNNNNYYLNASSYFYPFNLLNALLNYKAIFAAERISVIKFFCRLPFIHKNSLKNISIKQWLQNEGFSDNTISSFWELIAVSALNTGIHKASAKAFYDILLEILLKGNFNTKIIFPKYGLSKTYCQNASDFIIAKNGVVNLSEKITDIEIFNNKIAQITTSKQVLKKFDFVVSTVPLYSAQKFFPLINKNISASPELEYSSILSLHIKIKNNPLKQRYYGFISSPVHWVFNNGSYLTVVISDADELINKDKEEIYKLVVNEIVNYLGINKSELGNYRIIKEKRATFIPSGKILAKRPDYITNVENFYIAGDWTNTHLPSTIESAVKSGKQIADLIFQLFS